MMIKLYFGITETASVLRERRPDAGLFFQVGPLKTSVSTEPCWFIFLSAPNQVEPCQPSRGGIQGSPELKRKCTQVVHQWSH